MIEPIIRLAGTATLLIAFLSAVMFIIMWMCRTFEQLINYLHLTRIIMVMALRYMFGQSNEDEIVKPGQCKICYIQDQVKYTIQAEEIEE